MGFVSGTVVHAKKYNFPCIDLAAANDNVKARLIYGLCMITSVILLTYKTPPSGHLRFVIFQN